MTLTALYVNWKRAARADNLDGYVHRILVRRYLDERRLRWSRVRLGELPDLPATDPASPLEDRDELLTALRALPKGQRAVVVLRYLSDLSVEQTAEALGRSAGNVKSQCSRGLATLRELMGGAAVTTGEQQLRERLDTVDVPPVRLTVEGLIGSGRRRVRRRRAALATGVLATVAVPLALSGPRRDDPPAAAGPVGCPVRELPVPPGLTGVSADAIDPSGRYVLGSVGAPVDGVVGLRPVLWTDGRPQALPIIGKAARASAVNANGVVVALAAVDQTKNWDAIVRYTGGRPARRRRRDLGRWATAHAVRLEPGGKRP